MRVIPKIISLLFVTVALLAVRAGAADRGESQLAPNAAAGSDRVTFQAILVIASDEGVTDPSLAAYESSLKRLPLRFKSYRRAGDAAATVANGGEATLSLARGHKIDLWITSVTEKEIAFGVRWFNADQTLANTKVTRPRKSNTVVGGPATEDGKGHYAVIVTAN